MVISERIIELLKKKGMSQKEFSERTGIAQSAISDWKRKKTNPVSDKIMIICDVLDVTPEELLSGTDNKDGRSHEQNYLTISKESELGMLVETYTGMSRENRERLLGYMEALAELDKEK